MKSHQATFEYTTLSSFFTTRLGFNLARIKCLTHIVLALIEGRCVNLARLAGFCNTQATLHARYRRLQRFIKEVTFPPKYLAPLLLDIMEIESDVPLSLILDRTNWKFGQSDCNILYLAAVHQGIAIPLFTLY
jgi:hypothetical protein